MEATSSGLNFQPSSLARLFIMMWALFPGLDAVKMSTFREQT